MSCSTTVEHPWLTIDSRIVCDDCTLRLGASAPHQARFKNFGPLEVKIDMTASCQGPCLSYEDGHPVWARRLSVPRQRRRAGVATTSKGVELPLGSAIGTQGTDEEIEIEAKRLRGNGKPEKPVGLALRIKLRQ